MGDLIGTTLGTTLGRPTPQSAPHLARRRSKPARASSSVPPPARRDASLPAGPHRAGRRRDGLSGARADLSGCLLGRPCHDRPVDDNARSLADRAAPIRVLVVDDHDTFRQGLTMLLGLEPDIEVVGEATDGVSAADLAASTAP